MPNQVNRKINSLIVASAAGTLLPIGKWNMMIADRQVFTRLGRSGLPIIKYIETYLLDLTHGEIL